MEPRDIPRTHTLPADAFHFWWDVENPPVLTIESGDTVVLETREVTDDQITPTSTAEALVALDADRFYPLTGPIRIEGAAPGDTLAVDILELRPGSWGWSAILPGEGLLPDDFADPFLRLFELTDGDTVHFAEGITVPIAPFLGTMGVCPEGAHRQPVMPPGVFGGNLDTRQLAEGATLYLPIQVDGALFSCGDAHAAQGDGEVCVTAIETTMQATLRFSFEQDRTIPAPQFTTSRPDPAAAGSHYGTTGVGPDLYRAAQDAVRAMIDHLCRTYGLSREDAYILSSLCVDLRISEVVDAGQYVVTALLPTE